MYQSNQFNTLDDVLQHYGVKGMRWGVIRRGTKSQNGSKKPSKVATRIKAEVGSLKREREWKKVLADIDKMTTKDINRVTTRVQLENDLRSLSKKKNIGSKKDKQDYLKRADMSNEELSRKVTRLRAKDSLHRSVKEASRAQTELGERVVATASQVGLKYATGQAITPESVISAYKSNPKETMQRTKQEVLQKTIEAGTKKVTG